MIQYILDRLQEASTVRGIIYFLGSLAGISISSETANSIVYIILGLAGLVSIFLPDKFKRTSSPSSGFNDKSPESIEDSSFREEPIIPYESEPDQEYVIPTLPETPSKSRDNASINRAPIRMHNKLPAPTKSSDPLPPLSKTGRTVSSEHKIQSNDSPWSSGFNDK